MKISITTAILLFASNLAASPVHAQTVKKWVDAEGVTHYSDQKPANHGTEIKEFDIPKAAVSSYDSKEVNDRINKHLQQIQQDREARESEIEAKKQARELDEVLQRPPLVAGKKKKKDRDRDRGYRGPFPKPLAGPFPEKYPRPRGLTPPGS